MFGRLILALLALTIAGAAPAQDTTTTNAAIATLVQAAQDYRTLAQKSSGNVQSGDRSALQDEAHALSQKADQAVTILNGQMILVDERITQLGPPDPTIPEAPDIRTQRKALTTSRAQLDSAIKRGKLLAVEADQLEEAIAQSATQALNERITARAPSPLTGAFWSAFFRALPHDLQRLDAFVGKEWATVASTGLTLRSWPALLGLLIAVALFFPARIALAGFGRSVMIERAPDSRLRRSGLALWIAVSGTVMPGLAAIVLLSGLENSGWIAADWEDFASGLIRIAFVAGAVNAVGRALLQPKLPSWRLPQLSDPAATTLRHWTRVASGALLGVASLSLFTTTAVGRGSALGIAAGTLVVLLNISLTAGVLRSIGRLRSAAVAAQEETAEERPRLTQGGTLGAVALLGWTGMIAATGTLLAGYFPLALSIAQMLLWWPLVAASLYLLLIVTDDLCTDLVARGSRLGLALIHGFGMRPSLIDQCGVFLSALLRILFVALALTLAMGPFGSNVASLFDIATEAAQGLTIGEITVSPGAILRALIVLAVGLFVVRVAQRWLVDRYLPATELDAGARNSVAMVARYTGLILAALWAMASLGIGLERIALLLSALSVGIGFGLQAITQNFVSGLILLAERPVKIGDWVRIGTDEGDIKRISVRATEIQIADKSTLIVPNSELITKAVLNKTLADPLGRIQIQFSLPLGADVGLARDMLLQIYAETPAVLDAPAPSVFVDAIADGRVALNSFAYVPGPREVYSNRSAILFRLLDALPAAGIELGTTPQQMQIISGDLAPAAADPSSKA